MAATSLDQNIGKRGPIRQVVLDLASTATGASAIAIGTIVATATPSAGAVRAADTAGLVVQGVACQAGNFANGDRRIVVERGIFRLAQDGTITAASVGALATVLDNNTVSLAATTAQDIGAGWIVEVDSIGVWVDMTQAKIAAA
jgi:hypothetical protein